MGLLKTGASTRDQTRSRAAAATAARKPSFHKKQRGHTLLGGTEFHRKKPLSPHQVFQTRNLHPFPTLQVFSACGKREGQKLVAG